MNAKTIINQLNLQPHPEGGFYKETYRSSQTINNKNGEPRNVSTAIYYLLENEDKSHFHRVASDEGWFFHQGETIELISIVDGKLLVQLLGDDIELGEVPQIIIPANTWFAARIKSSKGYCLVSCTVAPGFDFADFELANKNELIQTYPHLKAEIEQLVLS